MQVSKFWPVAVLVFLFVALLVFSRNIFTSNVKVDDVPVDPIELAANIIVLVLALLILLILISSFWFQDCGAGGNRNFRLGPKRFFRSVRE